MLGGKAANLEARLCPLPLLCVVTILTPTPSGWRQQGRLFLQDKQRHSISSVARQEQLDFDLDLKKEPRCGDCHPHIERQPVPVRWRCAPWGQIF